MLGNGGTLVAGGYAIQGNIAVGQLASNLAIEAAVTGEDRVDAGRVRPTFSDVFREARAN